MVLCIHMITKPSDADKTSTMHESNSTQALTPYSPLQTTNSSPLPILPSTTSIDSDSTLMDEEERLQHDVQVAQYRHQKLVNRLKNDKENFFRAQESDMSNTTFSRWEKFKNKPEIFKQEQKNAAEKFLALMGEQLAISQAYELDCLQKLHNYVLPQNTIPKLRTTPTKKQQKRQEQQEKQLQEITHMKLRHLRETDTLIKENTKQKLIDFWNK